jgi:hypothetical protein
MDEEMQADQELLTAALDDEERAYNVYKNKINEWNAQGTKMESESKNASKWVTNHDQIEGKIQNSKQPNEEMQHKTPEKPLGKIGKTSKDESQGKHKEMKEKTERPKRAIDTTECTQKQTNGITIKIPEKKPASGKLDK